MKKILFALFLVFAFISLYAQNDKVKPVIDMLKQIRAVYDTSSNLSFDISYIYTDESLPNNILDSISGFIQINHSRYHWQIGTTETITNNRYAIMLFKEDKIMYVTKPFAKKGEIDPLALLDSSLILIKGLQTSIETQKKFKIIKLIFPEGNSCKNIQLSVDKKTGFLSVVDFVLKPEALGNSAGINPKDIKSAYVHIQAKYSNYRKDLINDSVFNESNYFIRDNNNFNTTAQYKDYKIFIGTPNL